MNLLSKHFLYFQSDASMDLLSESTLFICIFKIL